MNRRTYLGRWLATGAVVALAGCTKQTLEDATEPPPAFDEYDEAELDLPVDRTFDDVAREIERAADATDPSLDGVEEHLLDAGLQVDTLETVHGESVLELEYVHEGATREGVARGLGTVAGSYAALVRGDFDGDRLEASVLARGGRKFGSFEVATDWAEAYVEGRKTAASYGSEVLHTLKSA